MVLNEFNAEGVKVSFVYMPSWEMFMSMHVLAVPEHHLERRRWYQRIEKEHGNLVEKIRKMNRLTCDWTMIIDSDVWMEICLKSIPETLEIHTVYATVSTFLSPHLWLYERNGYIQFIKSVVVERKDEGIPQDFLNVFRALGDETRLKIIREILNGTRTTKALAGKVEVTEAAVSKHLKILWEAGLLEKKRCGNYVEYYVCRDVIDFIPYRFYELMQ